MRTDDIIMPKGSGISNYSTGLHMPSRMKAEEMTASQLHRGLCAKSAGNWHVCEICDGGCSIGDRLVAIMRGVVEEPTPEPIVRITAAECIKKMAEKRQKAVEEKMKGECHRSAIQKAARAALAYEQGMTKGEAARLAGHARWVNAEKTMKKYPEEVEAEKRRLRDEPPATP